MVGDLRRVVREVRRVLKPGGAFLFYEHVASRTERGRRWQRRVNPVWRFLTTGCNLDRDIVAVIEGEFKCADVAEFDLSVGLPVTFPNVVGVARDPD